MGVAIGEILAPAMGVALDPIFGRPKEAHEPALPSWMSSFEKTFPIMAFGLGAFLFGLDPKLHRLRENIDLQSQGGYAGMLNRRIAQEAG